jgi:hypothetical protein
MEQAKRPLDEKSFSLEIHKLFKEKKIDEAQQKIQRANLSRNEIENISSFLCESDNAEFLKLINDMYKRQKK